MLNPGSIVGIDWGTTHRRAYVLDAERNLMQQHNDDSGILAVAGNFESSLQSMLATLGLSHVNVFMSGMVGSRNGWQQVPYLSVDHPLSSLRDALVPIESALPGVSCRIVPGYQYTDAQGTPDVMRGEEAQVLGAIVLGAPEGWFLLPGTHSKWVHIENGKISAIRTFMTGELYALLSTHGTLSTLMENREESRSSFEAGLRAAQASGLTHAAFGCRAMVVTNSMPPEHAASYLSGVLIGAELADVRTMGASFKPGAVQVIGSPQLAEHYVRALEFFDIQAVVWQPDQVYVAALRNLAASEP